MHYINIKVISQFSLFLFVSLLFKNAVLVFTRSTCSNDTEKKSNCASKLISPIHPATLDSLVVLHKLAYNMVFVLLNEELAGKRAMLLQMHKLSPFLSSSSSSSQMKDSIHFLYCNLESHNLLLFGMFHNIM